jgi:hypothetical protein
MLNQKKIKEDIKNANILFFALIHPLILILSNSIVAVIIDVNTDKELWTAISIGTTIAIPIIYFLDILRKRRINRIRDVYSSDRKSIYAYEKKRNIILGLISLAFMIGLISNAFQKLSVGNDVNESTSSPARSNSTTTSSSSSSDSKENENTEAQSDAQTEVKTEFSSCAELLEYLRWSDNLNQTFTDWTQCREKWGDGSIKYNDTKCNNEDCFVDVLFEKLKVNGSSVYLVFKADEFGRPCCWCVGIDCEKIGKKPYIRYN